MPILSKPWIVSARFGLVSAQVSDAAQMGRRLGEGGRAVLSIAFEELGLHRVIGRLEPRNIASARVLEKLGMRREAHFVENEYLKGEWQSEAVYAILDREWRERTS